MMCAYDDCQNDVKEDIHKVTVTVTANRLGEITDRPAFCCLTHASKWLEKRAKNIYSEPKT